jgi:nitrite reductase/ring-hydroxylating ferredoxin subunit
MTQGPVIPAEAGTPDPAPAKAGGFLHSTPGRTSGRMVRLCEAGELAEGAARGFDPAGIGRDTMFVVRRRGLHAWRNACPHWGGTSMAWRKDAFLNHDASRIVCAAHGAEFDIASGACTLGPALGGTLARVDLIEAADGALLVDLAQLEETGT